LRMNIALGISNIREELAKGKEEKKETEEFS